MSGLSERVLSILIFVSRVVAIIGIVMMVYAIFLLLINVQGCAGGMG